MTPARRRYRRLALLLTMFAVAVLAGCGQDGGGGGADERPLVVTSVPILYSLAANVAGEKVRLENLLPSGMSPHQVSFRPEQAKLLAEADLLITNGAGLDPWADDLADATGRADLQTVVASRGVSMLRPGDETAVPGGGKTEDPGDVDPHVWLDPANAQVMVETIRDGLTELDPAHAADYKERAAAYVRRLRELDADIRTRTAGLPHRDFVSFHSAWRYYAQAYGLRQVAVIQEFPGKEPSPQYLAGIVDLVRELGVPAVIAEPQFSPRPAEAIAAETDARVYTADPEGNSLGAGMYIDLMRANTEVFVKAMGG